MRHAQQGPLFTRGDNRTRYAARTDGHGPAQENTPATPAHELVNWTNPAGAFLSPGLSDSSEVTAYWSVARGRCEKSAGEHPWRPRLWRQHHGSFSDAPFEI